jgi:hypothetical protein
MIGPGDISVVVPWHAACPHAQRVIARLLECAPPPREIIAVCDGPPEAPLHAAPDIPNSRLQQLWLHLPAGPAAARNHGSSAASGEFLFFCDSDVLVPLDLFAQLAAALNHHPAAAGLLGSYDDRPEHQGLVSQYRNLLHHFAHQQQAGNTSTFWTGCGAVRRLAFHAVGGFDAARFPRPSIEDVEFGLRLTSAGHPLVLVPSLQVTHLKHWRPLALLRTDLLDRALPWSRLLLARQPGARGLQSRPAMQAAVAASGLLLISIPALPLVPLPATATAVAALLAFLLLNLRFYQFLARRRGAIFLLAAIPWHFLHHLECAAGFLLAIPAHLTVGSAARAPDPSSPP